MDGEKPARTEESDTDARMVSAHDALVRFFAQFVSINEETIEKRDVSQVFEFVITCQKFVDLIREYP